MAIDTIWVFSQAANGAPTTGTLELLSKARALGAGEVAAFHVGDATDAGASWAPTAPRRSTRRATSATACPDRPWRAPWRPGRGGLRARPDHVPPELRGSRRDGPAVGQARPHRAHEQRRHRGRRRRVAVTTPIFGGNVLVTTTFTGDGPHLAAFRPKSFAAEESGGGPAEVVAAPGSRARGDRHGHVDAVHVEESTGPKLDEAASSCPAAAAWARRQLPDDRGPGEAAEGRAGRLPGDRRRRLGALQLPGRPDRQGREADRLPRRRDLRARRSTWWA